MQACLPPPWRQLTLAFPDTPAPSEAILKTLDPSTRNAALQALARILARTVIRPKPCFDPETKIVIEVWFIVS